MGASRWKGMVHLGAIVLLTARATAQNLAYSLIEDFSPATFFDHFAFNDVRNFFHLELLLYDTDTNCRMMIQPMEL